MNEIALSKDLNVITAEINSYKQVAGQAIFEIGRRLKHVKENDLVHGEWIKWLESIDMDRMTAHRFIKTYDELGTNVDTWLHLGSRVLYEIATLPEPEREKEHILPSGETKTVDKMTVRELQEVKRQLKEKERQLEQAQKSEKIALSKLEEAESKPPQVVEKEVVPDDYDKLKGGYAALEGTINLYKKQNEELRNELKQLEKMLKDNQSSGADEKIIQKLKKDEEELKNKINESYKIYDLQLNLEKLMSAISPSLHSINFSGLKNEYELLSSFENVLDGLISLCESLKGKLPNKNIIEGEIIDAGKSF